MSNEFKCDTKSGLWMTSGPTHIHRIVIDCLNSKIRKLDKLECKLIKDERCRDIIYSYVGEEKDPNVLHQVFGDMCNEEHDKFYTNAHKLDYVLNHMKTWVWCEPSLYPITRSKEIVQTTRDYWIANPSHIADAIDFAWGNGEDQDFYALMIMNEIFGNEYCKIVWRDFDYSKISALFIGELIHVTVDTASLKKYANKITNRKNEAEKCYLMEIVKKRLALLE
jgi:hypothetical protein